MKISVLMAELAQVEEFFGDIETTTNDVAVVQGLEHDKVVRLGITVHGGLNTDVLNRAMAEHEIRGHGVPEAEIIDIPADCLADTKERYDRLVRLA